MVDFDTRSACSSGHFATSIVTFTQYLGTLHAKHVRRSDDAPRSRDRRSRSRSGGAAPADPRAPDATTSRSSTSPTREAAGPCNSRTGSVPARRRGSRICSRMSESTVVVLCSPPAEHAESDPRERRGRQARDPVREAPRDDRGGRGGRHRRVSRVRHGAPGRHEPSVRPGVGAGQASPARRRPRGPGDLGHPRAAAERAVPRRRHRAAGARRRARARRPRPLGAAGRGIRRPSADHRSGRARPADAARPRPGDRAGGVRARGRSDRVRGGVPGVRHPGAAGHRHAARRRRCAVGTRDHHRHRRGHGVVSAGVRARRQRRGAGELRRGQAHDVPASTSTTAISPNGARSPTC